MTRHAFLEFTLTSKAATLALVAFGLANCFYGYRLFRVWLGIWGFLSGAAMSAFFLREMKIELGLQLLGVLVGGIVGAVLVSILYDVGVFLFGMGFGLLAAMTIQQHISIKPIWLPMVVLGLTGGVAALALRKPLITLFTAVGGAWVVVTTTGALLTGCVAVTFPTGCPRASSWSPAILGAWLVLGLLGLAAQMRQARGRRRYEDEEDD